MRITWGRRTSIRRIWRTRSSSQGTTMAPMISTMAKM
jgi:hypothetical protein